MQVVKLIVHMSTKYKQLKLSTVENNHSICWQFLNNFVDSFVRFQQFVDCQQILNVDFFVQIRVVSELLIPSTKVLNVLNMSTV